MGIGGTLMIRVIGNGSVADVPQDLQADILSFYRYLSVPIATKSNQVDCIGPQGELGRLDATARDLTVQHSAAPAAPGEPNAR